MFYTSVCSGGRIKTGLKVDIPPSHIRLLLGTSVNMGLLCLIIFCVIIKLPLATVCPPQYLHKAGENEHIMCDIYSIYSNMPTTHCPRHGLLNITSWHRLFEASSTQYHRLLYGQFVGCIRTAAVQDFDHTLRSDHIVLITWLNFEKPLK